MVQLCYRYAHAEYLQVEAMLRLVSLKQKVALQGTQFATDRLYLGFYRGQPGGKIK